jgi:SAM-dependent methyltransferase
MEATFARMRPGKPGGLDILDLGCGEGRFLKRLRQRQPNWTIKGVDPRPPRHADSGIASGSTMQIPFPDASFDGVYLTIVLQHIDDVDASLAEIFRVLRPGGVLIVFDRNLISIRGLLKPWHEIRGRWLYSWDSPFRERWYTLRKWRALFRRAGFQSAGGRSMTHLTGQGLRGNLPVNRFVFVTGQKP